MTDLTDSYHDEIRLGLSVCRAPRGFHRPPPRGSRRRRRRSCSPIGVVIRPRCPRGLPSRKAGDSCDTQVRGGRADGTLADGVKLGLLWYGPECTGAAPRTGRAPPPGAVAAALLLSFAAAAAAAAMAGSF